jgi:hypothetical protein
MRVSLQANYKNGPFGLNVQERWRSGGVWNSNRSLVYSDPDFPAYKVFDLGVTYDATVRGVDLQGFANISNLLNVEPQIKATDSPGQVTPIVAGQDAIGRYFTVGVRFKL